jgi:hypothetical protein
MYPDKKITLELANDADGDARDPVTVTLRQLLMKQRINKPKVWQGILPNNDGGFDAYFANGLGCAEHRSRALTWSACMGAHIRFYLLKRGVTAESMASFINGVFTYDAAHEAFDARLIRNQVYTVGAATAESTRIDIENSSWIDTALGSTVAMKKDSSGTVLQRPQVTLRHNTDPTAFNFADSKKPDVKDTGSVAYSAGGDQTLGGSEYGDENQAAHDEVDDVAVEEDINSFGSTESQLWTSSKKDSSNKATIIDNIDIVTKGIQDGKSAENDDDVVMSQEKEVDPTITKLLEEIALLRKVNEQLTASNSAQITGSRPTSQSANVGNKGDGGGGGH